MKPFYLSFLFTFFLFLSSYLLSSIDQKDHRYKNIVVHDSGYVGYAVKFMVIRTKDKMVYQPEGLPPLPIGSFIEFEGITNHDWGSLGGGKPIRIIKWEKIN